MTLVSLALDQREPAGIRSADYGAVAPAITLLSAGSAWAVCDDGSLLALWRLDAADLLHTIRQDTLKARAVQLRTVSPWSYLVIQGVLSPGHDGKTEINGKATGWTWGAVQGALLTLQELGIAIIQVGNTPGQFGDAVRRLAERPRGPAKITPLRDALFPGVGELILTALPGIGPERAETLLSACGSPAVALIALTDDSIALPGIGPETRQKARLALGLDQDMTFSIIIKEAKEAIHDTNTTIRVDLEPTPAAHP